MQFGYHLPFPPPFSLTPDAPVSLASLTYERASVLYNIAALYGAMAAAERRADIEGIKRALGYLSVGRLPPRLVYAMLNLAVRSGDSRLYHQEHPPYSSERDPKPECGGIRHDRELSRGRARVLTGPGAGVFLAAGSDACVDALLVLSRSR